MTCAFKSQEACLPVTALRALSVGKQIFLLAGRGPYLDIHGQQGPRILSVPIFETQSIHGIKAAPFAGADGSNHYISVIIFGGSFLRLAWLVVQVSDTISWNTCPQVNLLPSLNVGDWVLDAVLRQSSVFILTAHNSLLELPLLPISEQLEPLEYPGRYGSYGDIFSVSKLRSFLYSGCLCFVGPNKVLIASGTVFGEVLLWACSKEEDGHEWPSSLRHVFHAHNGSVFGVAMSEAFRVDGKSVRLLASCSDDRMVSVWDISDFNTEKSKGHLDFVSNETGFGKSDHTDLRRLGSAWGHLSRIWGVEFVTNPSSEKDGTTRLLSRGEDGACQMWTVAISGLSGPSARESMLRPLFNDRHHHGKNAWSMAHIRDEELLLVFTGGADGQIISRDFNSFHASGRQATDVSIRFNEIVNASTALKHYLLLDSNDCLATTDQGDLFRLRLRDGNLDCHRLLQAPTKGGLVLCEVEGRGFTIVAHQRSDFLALLTNTGGTVPVQSPFQCGITWMQLASSATQSTVTGPTCVVAVSAEKEVAIFWVSLEEDSVHFRRTSLEVPSTFTITSCYYDSANGMLLLGSRAGALAVYLQVTSEATASGESRCFRHVHENDTITSTTVLCYSPDTACRSDINTHILTTGRDGAYAIHQLSWAQGLDGAQPRLSLVHRATPSFGPSIEGAYFARTSDTSSSSPAIQDLILYGFQSTSFVVWNETQQSEILDVECGGMHRSWSYRDSPALTESPARSFVWTRGGKLNWHNSNMANHRIVQKGGHGREIKAVARGPTFYPDPTNKLDERTLIATGAEDTNILLFAFTTNDVVELRARDPRPSTSFQSIATLKRHTTGLQHLRFSPSGQHLFSSGSCQEFYVWKLTFNVPCVVVGVVLWDIMPTEDEDSDARIMCFDVHVEASPRGEENVTYMFVMAYSTGKTKIVRYTPSIERKHGAFELIREITYGTLCMMQAFFVSPLPASVSGSGQHDYGILSAGTNGFINLSRPFPASDLTCTNASTDKHSPGAMDVQQIHQSSILAMDVASLNPDTSLIATGGDDNALGLTILCLSHQTLPDSTHPLTSRRTNHHFRTLLVPSAHAAAVTAVKIISVRQSVNFSVIDLVTAGNDQRIRIWKLCFDVDTPGKGDADGDSLLESLQIKPLGAIWTKVADVSGLEVVHSGSVKASDSSILVVGVGMELLSVATGDP